MENKKQKIEIDTVAFAWDAEKAAADFEGFKLNSELELDTFKVKSQARISETEALTEKLAPALVQIGELGMVKQIAESLGHIAVFEKNGLVETTKTLIGNLPDSILKAFSFGSEIKKPSKK